MSIGPSISESQGEIFCLKFNCLRSLKLPWIFNGMLAVAAFFSAVSFSLTLKFPRQWCSVNSCTHKSKLCSSMEVYAATSGYTRQIRSLEGHFDNVPQMLFECCFNVVSISQEMRNLTVWLYKNEVICINCKQICNTRTTTTSKSS